MLGEAMMSYRRAMELDPNNTTAHSNLLCTLHYCAGITPAALAEAHAEFNRRHAAYLSSAAVRDRGTAHAVIGPVWALSLPIWDATRWAALWSACWRTSTA